MSSNDLGKELHDKAKRGLPLSVEEQMQLQTWCEEKNEEETLVLGLEVGDLIQKSKNMRLSTEEKTILNYSLKLEHQMRLYKRLYTKSKML